MKPPPHNLEAERALISACLINPSIISDVRPLFDPSDMYREAHKEIMAAVFDLGEQADLLSVEEALRRRNALLRCGGRDYLMGLFQGHSTSSGWRHWVQLLNDYSMRRKLIDLCSEACESAYEMTCESEKTYSDLKANLQSLHPKYEKPYVDSIKLVNDVFKDIERRRESKSHYVGIRTGLNNLDKELCGLEPKTSIYLIARPGIGKTALALNIADHVAQHHGKVIYFSLESGAMALTRRRLSSRSAIYLSRIRTGDIEQEEWPAMVDAADKLSESQLVIVDHPSMKHVDKMINFVEASKEVSLVVVDHIQLMICSDRKQSRNDQLGEISAKLQDLAKIMNIPVMILCQLSRISEQQRDTRPQMHHMRDSGNLEQNADVVLGLWRKDKLAEYARVECLKGRDIGTFHTWLYFDRDIQRFQDASEAECDNQEGKCKKTRRTDYG